MPPVFSWRGKNYLFNTEFLHSDLYLLVWQQPSGFAWAWDFLGHRASSAETRTWKVPANWYYDQFTHLCSRPCSQNFFPFHYKLVWDNESPSQQYLPCFFFINQLTAARNWQGRQSVKVISEKCRSCWPSRCMMVSQHFYCFNEFPSLRPSYFFFSSWPTINDDLFFFTINKK